ncbi:hypothetical protein P692DRAFT_20117168 [Suillus brevipes Sb2]|nr:hypothetical protein P692DRAFT_20117168 [Suillus brevipes Sb2]
MEDERPFATKHPRESSESTTSDMEDELHCLYASAHYPTDCRIQREAESSLKLTDRWIPGYADDNDKEQTDLRAQTQSPSRMFLSSATLGCVVLLRKPRLLEAENRTPTCMSPEFDGDKRVCVFDLVGSLFTIMTVLPFGTKMLEKIQSSLLDFPTRARPHSFPSISFCTT